MIELDAENFDFQTSKKGWVKTPFTLSYANKFGKTVSNIIVPGGWSTDNVSRTRR